MSSHLAVCLTVSAIFNLTLYNPLTETSSLFIILTSCRDENAEAAMVRFPWLHQGKERMSFLERLTISYRIWDEIIPFDSRVKCFLIDSTAE
jgi:hypothetical protein